MPAKKRTTLPKDFEDLLKNGDVAALKAVFEKCDLSARGGYAKQTALAFDACPDELARWLVAEGLDVDATDARGNTPLHARSRSWATSIDVLLELGANVAAQAAVGTPLHAAATSKQVKNAGALLARGAAVDAKNPEGLTPLEVALQTCTNAELDRMPAFVGALIAAGAERTPAMKRFVKDRGEQFEFHRAAFAKSRVDAASAGLEYLYDTFDVAPVARREMHDGKKPIGVGTQRWQDQHKELWQQLVPSRGPAQTVQGEVIRISGRIGDEWYRNGGANWDGDYRAMANALTAHVQSGAALSRSEVEEMIGIVANLAKREGAGNDRLAELAVAWVLRNPEPLPLAAPSYAR